MAFYGTFIGINKYADERINDLAGAERDATALWALFVDSVPDIITNHLVDGHATSDAIRNALDRTLGAAGPDDSVLFFFAGHGSTAHQLVPHDANIEAIPDTTIPMDEIAARLATTHAKAVIVILDCCYSGGATARVLTDVPVPRGPIVTVADLQGKGRVIIAASKDNEAAYEYHGHGLLTSALLDVFINSKNGVNIGQLTDEITAQVRAQASRFGWEQTPVFFNLIEGGLVFPPFRLGETYLSAFPETKNTKITNDINSLTVFGFAQATLQAWQARFQGGLNALQVSAVNEHRVLDGHSLLVVAPTSAGKTFIGEMAAVKAVSDGKKAVFLLPFRALVNEKYDDFLSLYGDTLGFRIIRCTGDYTDDTSAFIRGKYDIALLTYEMFLGLSIGTPSLLTKIGLIILDEAQFITDPVRGIAVELLLTNVIAARVRGIDPQIIALSAVIGDICHFDKWIGCDTLYVNERPVPLVEGVLDRSGAFTYRTTEDEKKTEQFVPRHLFIQRKAKPSSQDILVPLVKQLVAGGENVLIFRNQRGNSVGCAIYLASELGLPPATEIIQALPTYDMSLTSHNLRKALQGGTAFHNSDLIREERIAIEQAFRTPRGSVRVLTATTTVAAGINTPATTVIIVETEFMGAGRRDFTVAEYKNMAGRAGRLGLSESGRSILIADNSFECSTLYQRYIEGTPEPMCSSFSPDDIETWVLRLLTQVRRIGCQEVIQLLANTYGGYLACRADVSWQGRMQERIDAVLIKMRELSLVEEENGQVALSLLGQACGRSSLSFSSAIRMVEILKRNPTPFTPETLMAAIQILPEVGGYTSVYKKGMKESAWQQSVAREYGIEIARLLQDHATDIYDYYGRCKRAAILWQWINGIPTDEIERVFSATPYAGSISSGDIRRFADSTRLYLRAAYEIAHIAVLENVLDEVAIDSLLRRLEIGLPEVALPLLSLPLRLTRGEYLALLTAGHSTLEAVQSLSTSDLSSILSPERAEQLVQLFKVVTK